jgi:hypothetical protein
MKAFKIQKVKKELYTPQEFEAKSMCVHACA